MNALAFPALLMRMNFCWVLLFWILMVWAYGIPQLGVEGDGSWFLVLPAQIAATAAMGYLNRPGFSGDRIS